MPDQRGVLPLSVQPPSVVVLDTSAVICALVDDQPQHDEYAGFIERAIIAGTAFVYCDLLDFELADAAITVALKRRHGRAWFRHRGDHASLSLARRLMDDVFSRWRTTLAATSSARLPLGPLNDQSDGSPVRDRAFALLDSYPIRSYDAAHAATALLVAAPLVCRDVGFAEVSADRLTLITDSTRTGPCRARRADGTSPASGDA
jgi:predicted nucleic acid-binding protein